MGFLQKLCSRFLHEDKGATAVEYAILLAVIIILCIGAILNTGDVQSELFFETNSAMNQAMFPNN